MKRILYISMIALLAGGILTACKGKKSGAEGKNLLLARAMSDPDMLNPINLTSVDGRYIANLIFLSLEGTDPKDYHQTPVLAVSRPKISEVTEGEWKGGIKLDYEISPSWNGP